MPINSRTYGDDPDDWDAADADEFEVGDFDDDDLDMEPCPNCGVEIYEDAPQCPACGEAVVHSTHPFAGRPLWWIALGVIGIVALILLLVNV